MLCDVQKNIRTPDLINNINTTYNVFKGYEETQDYEFLVDDIDDAIEKFRCLCFPENEVHDNEAKCWFYLILFYLNRSGFVIEEFPRVIERPPVDTYDFVYKEIRARLIADGKAVNGTVKWEMRRVFVRSFTFTQKEPFIELEDAIERKFKEISNRHASFQAMSTDEKLAEIANLIEHLLKKNGKFIKLDYTKTCFDYIDEAIVMKYRKRLHCFRHSSTEALEERELITNEQKNFLIDYGLTIIKSIHVLLYDN